MLVIFTASLLVSVFSYIRPHRADALPVDVSFFAQGIFVYLNPQTGLVAYLQVAVPGQIGIVHPVLPLVAQG